MTLKLLAVGDMHLGRLPSRLPQGLTAAQARELGPDGAWRRVVEAAVEAGVHAVALAGDVVEQEHDFFEGYRELHRGLSQLVAAGIRTLAVAGNHDVLVLPRLADRIDGFELLGRGGIWQQTTLAAGSERLTLHGWSFPQRQVTTSPLPSQPLQRGPGVNLGLLHCDRDQPHSVYAPVRTAELTAAGLDGWLLGHIHAPDDLSRERSDGSFGGVPGNSPGGSFGNSPAGPVSGYLGSLTGLHVGEAGPRGPWLVEIDGGRIAAVTQWALAPLHWEHLEVDLSGLQEPEEARERLLERIAALDARLTARPHPPLAAGVRVLFTGRTARARAVEALLQREDLGDIPAGSGRIRYFVERHRYATLPEVDLAELARRTDPPGLLARRLEILARAAQDPQRQQLLQAARRQLAPRAAQRFWQPLPGSEAPDDEAVADWLRRSGLVLLERLLATREPAR